MPDDPNPLAHLHRFILVHYSLEELRTLCFALGVAYDDLPGEGRQAKARELLLHLGRQQQFLPLLERLRQEHAAAFAEASLRTDADSLDALYAALPAYDAPDRPTPTVPTTAPAPPAHFVGREAEIDRLTAALTRSGTPQAITALQGMGGIGKTALAQKLAQRLAPDFPGGVFWADLPANEGDPMPILATWARLCGQDASGFPDAQSRAQAVRGILADWRTRHGPVLVILDDVRPEWLDGARLLRDTRPDGAPLLLTTRETPLAQKLRARVTPLGTLDPAEARALLADLTGGALTGPTAARVAEICGCLPLALELAAALADQEGADWLLTRLEDAATRLDALALDDPARKGESVRLTFDLSYETLIQRYPETARVWRWLSVFAPAPIAPARVAGVLAFANKPDDDRAREIQHLEEHGEPLIDPELAPAHLAAIDTHLRCLVNYALLSRQPSAVSDQPSAISDDQLTTHKPSSFSLLLISFLPSSFILHPLLRAYAAEKFHASGDDPAAHTAYYLAYARAHRSPTAADYDALDAERLNCFAAMDRAEVAGQWAQVRRFAWALCDPVGGYLGVRGYWADLRDRLEQAIRAAESSNSQYDLTAFTEHRAALLLNTGDLSTARAEYQRALELWRAQNNRAGEAVVLHQLGRLAQATGDLEEARRLYCQSLEIEEALGNQAGIATSLHQLGILAQATGDLEEARRLYRQSLEIKEALGNQAGIAISLHQLAILAQATGDLDEARRLYRQSLEIKEALGDQAGIALTVWGLGNLAYGQDELDEARQQYEKALATFQDLGDKKNEAGVLGQLANLAQKEEDQVEVEQLYRRAWDITEEIGDVVGASIHMFNLALLYEDQGRLDEALPLLERAVAIAEQVGMPVAESRRQVLERVRGKL